MRLDTAFSSFDVAMAGVRAEATRRSYKQSVDLLINFGGNVDIMLITLNDLRAWRAELASRKSRFVDHPCKPVLCWEAVDLERRHALVNEKGDKARRVFFTRETAEALRCYKTERNGCDRGSVFVGRCGPLTENGIYQVFKRLAKLAGVKGPFNPHAWRHAWAGRALRRGARLEHISEALGHSSSVVTKQFYLVWDDRIRQETHEKFGYLE